MKAILAALLFAVCSLCPCVHAQQSDKVREYQAKAEKGDTDAQSNLGVCYLIGDGIEKNFAEAVKWFRKAAEQGNVYAQTNLGVCYENGQGVEKNWRKPFSGIERAPNRVTFMLKPT